jgi:XRE family aerobic/anaerobic benzoate catabolism transcriptional regulator
MANVTKTQQVVADPALDSYIGAIGERVRGMRARRGMSRKQLGGDSGVSERYLAQLETGKANISIGLLWQIAQAMGVPAHELLPDATPRVRSRSRRHTSCCSSTSSTRRARCAASR